jgi:hypothetical protein
MSINDLINCLSKGFPVVMGVAYKSSGHMVLAVGYDLEKEVVYVHDPYGVRYGYSNDYQVGVDGSYDTYSFDLLRRIWVEMGESAGWGRYPTAILDNPTFI